MQLRELRALFLPEQEKAEGELAQPKGWLERDGARLVHPPKLQQRKFCVIIRKLLRVNKCWNRLPRETEIFILRDFQNLAGQALSGLTLKMD